MGQHAIDRHRVSALTLGQNHGEDSGPSDDAGFREVNKETPESLHHVQTRKTAETNSPEGRGTQEASRSGHNPAWKCWAPCCLLPNSAK